MYKRDALSYEKLNNFKNAIANYNSAISSDIDNKSDLNNKLIFYNIGILYGQQNQLDKAIEAFTNAIKIENLYADSYHNRGYALKLLNNHEKAILDFDKAIEIDPSNVDYRDSKNRSLEMIRK